MKESSYVSAVVYLHNDEEYVEDFLDKVYSALESHFSSFEFVFINDFCSDSTMELVKRYFAEKTDNSISIVNLCYYHGLQNAMKAGVDLCIGDYIYEFDNVYAMYDSSLVYELYKECQNGFDIVAASENKKMPLLKRTFYAIFNKYSIVPGRIEPEFFRLYSRRTLNRMNEINQYVIYRRAIYASTGLKKKNLYFNSVKKINSKKAKESRKPREETIFNALLLFTYFPRKVSKLSILLSSILFFISVVFVILCAVLWKDLLYIAIALAIGLTILLATSCFFAFIIAYLQVMSSYTVSNVSYNFESIEKISK